MTMAGRVCAVTGPTRGIGLATARALAHQGATVLLLARDESRAFAVRDALRRESGNDDLFVVGVDLASFASIRLAAQTIAARHDAIDVLVHNAAVSLLRRTETADGIEATLAVNHLAPFLLTALLLPHLRRAAVLGRAARVVTVTSMFERFGRIDVEDLERRRHYIGVLAYTQSKLANILFTRELAERLVGSGVSALSADPGLAATDLMRDRFWYRASWIRPVWDRLLQTPAAAARAPIRAATDPTLESLSGECIDARGSVVNTSRRSRNRDLARRLWAVSETMTGARW